MKRVGYYFGDGKIKRLKFDDYLNKFKPVDFDYVKIDFSKETSPEDYDLIVHKCSHLSLSPDDESSIELQRARELFSSAVPVIDPVENIKALFNRFNQFTLLKQCIEEAPELAGKVFVPNFCVLDDSEPEVAFNRMLKAGLRFPIVCKPIVAQGDGAHNMCLVFHKEGLKDVPTPIVAQKLINHNAFLLKVSMVGSHVHIARRPSLKNFSGDCDQATRYFHSHNISKDHSGSDLNQLDEEDRLNTPLRPDYDLVLAIAAQIRQSLRLDLLSIDVIIDIESKKYGVIDVNSFPGYESMPDFYDHFEELIREKLQLPNNR